jgi:L-ribulose-5-phosphate 3-epimerase
LFSVKSLLIMVDNEGALLAAVIKQVNHRRCGTLPDFGNFDLGGWSNTTVIREREMIPFARAVSAKTHNFDERGNETGMDYRRMLKIVLEAVYHGHVGIEYEGARLSEPDGIRTTKVLLERIHSELL